MMRIKLPGLVLLILAALATASGADETRKRQGGVINDGGKLVYMNYAEMARRLVDTAPDSSPMILAHARGLVAGDPGKSWKNCLLQDTLQAQLDARAGQVAVAGE